MLVFKLRPVGKKHQRSFRLIVQEKREKLQGKFAEDLGWYNPRVDQSQINKERTEFWLKNGAQPTPTVHNLFVSQGLISGPKIQVHKKSRKKEEAAAVLQNPTEKKAEEKKESQEK